MSDTQQDKTEEDGKGAILPDPVGEDGFVQPKDDGEKVPTSPGGREPSDQTGRHGAKSDGNPYVTGDVRSS